MSDPGGGGGGAGPPPAAPQADIVIGLSSLSLSSYAAPRTLCVAFNARTKQVVSQATAGWVMW